MKGNKHKKSKNEQKKVQRDHEAFRKLSEQIDEYYVDLSHLQHKILKLLLEMPRNIRTDEEYDAVKKLVDLYRKNEQDLSKLVKLYEAHLDGYAEEKNFTK